MIRLDRFPKRRADPYDFLLADKLVKRFRPHPISQRGDRQLAISLIRFVLFEEVHIPTQYSSAGPAAQSQYYSLA